MQIKRFIRSTLPTLALLSILLTSWLPSQSRAHELHPSIADLRINSDGVEMTFYMAVEPFLTGINLSAIEDIEEAPESAEHDRLRALPPDEIEDQLRKAWPDLRKGFSLYINNDLLPLEIKSISVGDIGNPELPRETILTLAVAGKPGIPTAFTWGDTFGLLALRVDSGAEQFELLLNGGETAEIIPPSAFQIFINYIKIGFEHIVPKGLDHILFVLGLFFFSIAFRPLLWQVTAFTLAHTATLALAMTGIVTLPASIVEPLIALSIAYVAIENILGFTFGPRRVLVVFGFGLLHGLGFAGVLSEIGLSAGSFALGLIAFNIGVEIGQLAVLAAAWILIGSWAANRSWYRTFIAIPASAIIGFIGLYWTIERIFL